VTAAASIAEGATMGAPQSQQIADRFHLILNLSATMERVLEERSRQLVLPPAEDASTVWRQFRCRCRDAEDGKLDRRLRH
jgi:hypothetical protein